VPPKQKQKKEAERTQTKKILWCIIPFIYYIISFT
jgi:hypothetical protein